ncbi:MAG: biotin transporter BioY, partial [Clostridia bacterium]|nr:biotin transporter BioY [Clostridia bacterium]
YLVLGAVGVPVFAGFRGGIAQLVGPTGGFLFGFLPAVLIAGYLPQKLSLFVRMLFGLLACYACGTAWYCILYTKDAGIGGILAATLRCVVPFVLPDVLKLFLAAKATEILQKRL